MNLYFLNADGKEKLVKENVTNENFTLEALKWLKENHPEFKSGYQRCWVDDYDRYWIDFGSWNEFFIAHAPYEQLEIDECEVCRID